MEPRNIVVGADAVSIGGRQHQGAGARRRARARQGGPPRSESRACTQGIPRNLGAPVTSSVAGSGRGRGTAERGNEVRRGRATGFRRAAVVPRRQGNQSEGPCGGKGGTGRARWARGRATTTGSSGRGCHIRPCRRR